MLPIYGALIKVITGFYLGCTGYLVARHNFYVDQFEVKLFCEYQKDGVTNKNELDVILQTKDFEIINTPRQ